MLYLLTWQFQTFLSNEIPAEMCSEECFANEPISCQKQFIANRDNSFDNIMKQRHITIVTTFINYQPTSRIPCKWA